MALAEERAAYAALALTPGIGAARLDALLQHCGSAHGALTAPFAFLCTVPGLNRAAATAIKSASLAQGEAALQQATDLGAQCLLLTAPDFPAVLRQIPDPPTLLFALGNLALLQRPAVAIVGSRDHSDYGASVCRDIAGTAARAGITVVSGMARGLDAVAHSASLDGPGGTIGILGNGLGVVYPAANRELYARVSQSGLLLTEFGPGERPGVGSFPRRNRLISGLARVTVVVEAAEGSGTLITVAAALGQGRDVMAVPGNITSPTSAGTNRLIRDGAEPLLVAQDLLEHYPEVAGASVTTHREVAQVSLPLEPPADLPENERRLFQALVGAAQDVDTLADRCSLPPGATLAALSGLELRGLALQERGLVRLTEPPPR